MNKLTGELLKKVIQALLFAEVNCSLSKCRGDNMLINKQGLRNKSELIVNPAADSGLDLLLITNDRLILTNYAQQFTKTIIPQIAVCQSTFFGFWIEINECIYTGISTEM